MSANETVKISCPECQKDGDFTVWQIIDVAGDPEKKHSILSKSLFEYTCPHCNVTSVINYDFMYHDSSKELLIFFATSENSLKTAQDIFTNGFIEKDLAEDVKDLLKANNNLYKKRIVTNLDQLVEKILLDEDKLDDRIMEIVKLLIRIQIVNEKPDFKFDQINYYGENEQKDSFVFNFMQEGQVVSTMATSKESYDKVIITYGQIIKDFEADNYCIEPYWALRCFQSFPKD